MTPKEKADDLFNKMLNGFQFTIDKYTAIQCSLIAVDEIINCDYFFKTLEDTKEFTKYWYEVKQEIEKL